MQNRGTACTRNDHPWPTAAVLVWLSAVAHFARASQLSPPFPVLPFLIAPLSSELSIDSFSYDSPNIDLILTRRALLRPVL